MHEQYNEKYEQKFHNACTWESPSLAKMSKKTHEFLQDVASFPGVVRKKNLWSKKSLQYDKDNIQTI